MAARPSLAAAPAGAAGAASAVGPAGAAGTAGTTSAADPAGGEPLQLLESFPLETTLDHADIPQAYDVWPEMIASAEQTLDFAEFYASNEPGSRLEPVIRALEEAAERGVHVRFLAEEKFYRTYPETLDRLARSENIEVRRISVFDGMGGVQHAKYFLVDGREAYLGSQNFDWRSLDQIQELGVRIRDARVVEGLAAVFRMDWEAAGRGTQETAGAAPPIRTSTEGDTTETVLVASPRDRLPPSVPWDLPRLVELIDAAKKTLRVQLLTYRTVDREGRYFGELESALRRAAARGVEVRLLLSDWCMRAGTIEGLKSLEPLPGVEVRLVTIPPFSGGFIPYARVIHAKYMVADGRAAWIGTGNWERDYFYSSRNVGLILRGGAIPARLDRFFADTWDGPYAAEVDPCRAYQPPRIGE